MSPDALSVLVRAACFLCLFQACGTSFFLAGWGARLAGSAVPIARLGRWAAAAGVLLVLAHQFLEATRMAGDYEGFLDGGLQWLALASSGGAAHGAQALGLLLIVAGLAPPLGAAAGRARLGLAIAGSALALLAFTITGHTSVAAHRAVLAPLLAVHLAIVAFWFGALAPLCLVLARESQPVAGWALRRFSAIAVFLVPVIPIAGLALAWGLVPGFAVLRRPYGELLAVKLAGFALLMVFASLNHSRLVPAFVRDGRGGAAPGAALRGTLAAEMALLATVFAVTAVLTGYYAPDH